MNINYPRFLTGLLLLAATASFAQEEEKKEEDMYVLSLEQLMNIPIKSASKKEETLFDAPLSSYTITRAEIDKAGSTSIMEALRLSPGVIVREQLNGEYDIHIRGMDNLSRSNGQFLKSDAYTLVMIDNRPVFNHGLGGTFWESLPVDINDVDRIEIVRGPSSPLFGPNAVTGVINIITKRMGESKTFVSANVQTGTIGTSTANATVGKTFGKFSAVVTGNFQDRQRVDSYYFNDTTYVPLSEIVPDATSRNFRYPQQSRALNKNGVNGYFTYKANDNVNFDLSLSTQTASTQRYFVGNQIEYSKTNNSAVNFAAAVYGFKLRSSYLSGYNSDVKNGYLGGGASLNGEYDFDVADVNAEYDFKIGKNYTITPGVSYQDVKFDDAKYIAPMLGQIGYFNAPHNITTTAGFLRTDLNFTDKLRVIAAGRVDKFSVPDKAYAAYEFAGTYKFNAKNLVRVAVTRSNSGSFMGYNYLNIGGGRVGNQDLKLFTLSMIEVGYRSQLAKSLQLDIDIFKQDAKNLTVLLANQLVPNPPTAFGNVPTTAEQIGTTISLNFVPNDKIQLKPFITLQKTTTKDLSSVYLDPAIAPQGYLTYSNSTHQYTPGSFGGFYFNYQPVAKLNVNLSGYYYSKQVHYDRTWTANDPNTSLQASYAQISAKFTANLKVSYEVVKGLNVFINSRNVFNDTAREFYGADRTKGLYMVGASYHLTK